MEAIINKIKNNNYDNLINKENINKKYIDNNSIIHYSILHNNVGLLKKIIDKYGIKNMFSKNKNGENIFHLSGKNKIFIILDYILDNNIKLLDSIDNNGNTGLHYLIDEPKKLLEIFNKFEDKIKKNKINLNKISNEAGTLLLNFIKKSKKKNDEYYKLIEKLLKFNINLNKPHNLPPLIYIVKFDKEHVLDLLLNNKIDVNIIDLNGLTPIFHAVENNNLKIFNKLIENKANINFYDEYNNIQLINFIIKKKNITFLKILLKMNIKLNILDRKIELPIHKILKNNFNKDIIEIFLQKTNNLNQQNINGNTPLYFLIKNYNWEDYTSILQKKELDIFIKNKEKKSIIDLVKNKKDFYDLVIKSYLYYSNEYKDYKSDIIKKCRKEKNLNKDCVFKITKLINTNKKSIVNKKNIEINFITSKVNYLNKFNSSFIHLFILIIYLLKKYDNLSIPYLDKIEKFKNINGDLNDIIIYKVNNWINIINKFGYKLKYMDIFWYDEKINWINPYFKDAFKNADKRFVLVSLIIITKETNHQNILIYDKKTNNIERFEPYGYINNKNSIDLDSFLEKIFKNIDKKINYISPKIFMNRMGFQNISENEDKFENTKISDPNGFCIAWSLWYVEMRLLNPDKNNIDLITNSINKIINLDKNFTEYIRDYANKLFEEIIKYFTKIKFEKKYYYNKLFNKKILEYLNIKIIKPELDKILK